MSEAIKTLLQQYRLVAPVNAIIPAVASSGADGAIVSGVL